MPAALALDAGRTGSQSCGTCSLPRRDVLVRRIEADAQGIDLAARAISAGEIVAFPTDTAYGLGVRPDAPAAIDALYVMKGRPASMPLILLAADPTALASWAILAPDSTGMEAGGRSLCALDLAREFWPGPLTLVVPAGHRTPARIATPEGTVGVRVPAHPIALALLARTGPLATTSANRSGAPSPRSAADVIEQLGHDPLLGLLLDAGPTYEQADSTVLTLVGPPRILRQGALSARQLGLEG